MSSIRKTSLSPDSIYPDSLPPRSKSIANRCQKLIQTSNMDLPENTSSDYSFRAVYSSFGLLSTHPIQKKQTRNANISPYGARPDLSLGSPFSSFGLSANSLHGAPSNEPLPSFSHAFTGMPSRRGKPTKRSRASNQVGSMFDTSAVLASPTTIRALTKWRNTTRSPVFFKIQMTYPF